MRRFLSSPWTAIALMVCLAVPGLSRGLWLDEYGSVAFADAQGAFWWVAGRYNHPPLYYLVLWFWRLLGEGEIWLRALSLVFGAVTVWAIWATLKALRPRSAPWGAYLTATHPALLWHYQEIRPYSLLFCTLSLSLLACVKLNQRFSPLRALALLATAAAALSTHTVALLAVPLWACAVRRSAPLILGAGLLLFIFYVWPELGRTDWWYPPPNASVLWAIASNQAGTTVPIVLLGFATGALALLVGGQDRRQWLFFGAALWVFACAYFISRWLLPMMLPRTLAFSLLLLLPAIALAVDSLSPRWRPLGQKAVLFTFVFWMVGWLGWGLGPKEPFKEIFTELRDHSDSRDVLLLTPQRLGGLRVGTFYTRFPYGRFHALGEGDLLRLPWHMARLDRALFISSLPGEREFHVFVVIRKRATPWVFTYLNGLVGAPDSTWHRGHLSVVRFTVDVETQRQLRHRWAEQRWAKTWQRYHDRNPQLPWPPPTAHEGHPDAHCLPPASVAMAQSSPLP